MVQLVTFSPSMMYFDILPKLYMTYDSHTKIHWCYMYRFRNWLVYWKCPTVYEQFLKQYILLPLVKILSIEEVVTKRNVTARSLFKLIVSVVCPELFLCVHCISPLFNSDCWLTYWLLVAWQNLYTLIGLWRFSVRFL